MISGIFLDNPDKPSINTAMGDNMLAVLEKLYQKTGRLYKSGSVIFLENDIGDEMFLIVEGMVQISKQYPEYENLRGAQLKYGSNVQVLAQLDRGDFFGEMALITGEKRCATAVALGDVKLIVIQHDLFEKVIRESKELLYQIMKSLTNRLREASKYMRIIPEAEEIPGIAYKAEVTAPVSNTAVVPAAESDGRVRMMPNSPKSICCPYCKANIESKDIFCWQCGKKTVMVRAE